MNLSYSIAIAIETSIATDLLQKKSCRAVKRSTRGGHYDNLNADHPCSRLQLKHQRHSSEPQTEPASTPEPTDDPTLDIDDDGDGYSENEGDCDDSDPLLNPVDEDQDGASPCDGDCDDNNNTLNLNDADGDGQSTCDGDCDDGNAVIYQGATELCDGQVNDCADELWGSTEIPLAERDEDGDGYVSCESTQSEWVGAAPSVMETVTMPIRA